MSNLQQKLKRRNVNLSESINKDNQRLNRSAIIGSFIGTFIALTPYIFSLHESVPNQRIWDTFLFTYDSGFWEDAQYSMWVITSKAIPLILLLIWFFTSRQWWFHSLIVPILMYIFQIVEVFSVESTTVDELQIIYLLPIMAIIIPSIYLIRAKMFNKINDADKSLEELEEEFMIKPKGFFNKWSNYF